MSQLGVVCMIGLLAAPAAAQTPPLRPAPQDSNAVVFRGAADAPLLDGAITRHDYVLGPGDVTALSIFGEINRVFEIPVTPEGTLVVPGVGVANVLGLTLDRAEARVASLFARQYRNVQLNLTLARVRTFKFYLLGAVNEPGVGVASSVTRVSEVVPHSGVVRRNISLRKSDGSTITVDLLRFSALGDMSANPRLQEGDVVFVPPLNQVVTLIGRFVKPATIEYRAGETLAEVIVIANAGGPFPADAADTVRISRVTPDGSTREIRLLSRSDALGAAGRSLVLQPHDAIYVAEQSEFAVQPSATVAGSVMRPGTYPIRQDTTTVRDLIMMAGGVRPDAAPDHARLVRQSAPVRRAGLEAIPAEVLSRDERRIMQAQAITDPNSVSLDFGRILAVGGDAFNQTLRNGDVLNIPRLRLEVTVVGAVTQPGIVQYSEGQAVSHYIRLAGGYTDLADKGDVVVLKARTGARIDAGQARSLEPGDQIVVPFKERVTLFERLQRTQTIIGTISALIVTFIGIQQLIR